MSVGRRTRRDERRRRLGQNFLRAESADRFVSEAGLRSGELVVEVGAGDGAVTRRLSARGVRVIAVELDPVWARRLDQRMRRASPGRIRVVHADFLSCALPDEPFRVVGSLPFGRTTDVLARLLDDPRLPLLRADLILQWEVARKRAALPPRTLRSTSWAPWWEFHLGRRIPARAFEPVPRVDAGVLVVTRRDPPLLPPAMARSYAGFVRSRWPFSRGRVP